MTTSNTCIVLVVIPVVYNPVDLGHTFISSIAVDEAYEWLALWLPLGLTICQFASQIDPKNAFNLEASHRI